MKVPIDDYACVNLDAPTLPAYERRGYLRFVRWLVWCDHCQAWHQHGQLGFRWPFGRSASALDSLSDDSQHCLAGCCLLAPVSFVVVGIPTPARNFNSATTGYHFAGFSAVIDRAWTIHELLMVAASAS